MTADKTDALLAKLKEGLADKEPATVSYKDRTIRYRSQEEVVDAIRQLGGDEAVRELEALIRELRLS
jgi:hypothetical protein